uniref:Protein SirB1 N-terminal domain-containing protein n=1 Tax=Auxenochlorella protothecoides TaxID=3075 RepID=A0A1D2ACJ4_AUXPR
MVAASLARRVGLWGTPLQALAGFEIPLSLLASHSLPPSSSHQTNVLPTTTSHTSSPPQRLQSQLDVLSEADDGVIKAMDQWSELVRAHLPLCEASAAASAMVHGALLLDQQLDQLAEDDDDDDDDGMGGTGLIQHTSELPALGERKEWCYARIAELAQQNDVGDPAASRSDALAALVQNLHSNRSLCFKPFEWLYTGVTPLRLAAVLQGGTGAPLLMGVAAAGIADAKGIPALVLPFRETGQGVSQPRTGAAARPARAHLPTIPSSQWWYVSSVDGGDAGGAAPVCIDVTNGKRVKPEEVQRQSAEDSVLGVWRGLVRLSMEAYQRRGESDAVARWTHLLLSLDADAPEWEAIMPGFTR